MESDDVGLSAVPQRDSFISTFVSLDLYSMGDINVLFNSRTYIPDEFRVSSERPFVSVDDDISNCLRIYRQASVSIKVATDEVV